MLLTGLQYQSVLVTLIRFQHVRKSEASFIRISPHNGACFHVENSTRLLLIRYFNHLLCSTFGPTVPLWRVIKRLWSSSRRKNSWHCSGEDGHGSEGEAWKESGKIGFCWPIAWSWATRGNMCPLSPPFNALYGYCWTETHEANFRADAKRDWGLIIERTSLVSTLDSSQHLAISLKKAGRQPFEGFTSILMVSFALKITDSLGPDWFLWIQRILFTFTRVFSSEEKSKFSIPTGVSICRVPLALVGL